MNRSARIFVLFATIVAAIVFATELASRRTAALGKPKASPAAETKGQFIRVNRDEKGEPIAMETSIVRLQSKDDDGKKLTVDLVSAVHVGEKSYYDNLNKRFESYDAVLYELVAPEGTRIPKGGKKTNGNALSAVQNGLKDLLELEYQLTGIDYTKKNLVHADMSPEDFAKSMEKRGESMWTILMQMAAAEQARQKTQKPAGKGERYWSVALRGLAEGLFPGVKVNPEETKLMMALMDRNRALKLRRVLADQFEDMETMMAAFNGPNGSTLITERNKAALEVLKREIGKGHKNIAIFYGGGHMPDFEKRLVEDYDLKRGEVEWLEAWDLREKD